MYNNSTQFLWSQTSFELLMAISVDFKKTFHFKWRATSKLSQLNKVLGVMGFRVESFQRYFFTKYFLFTIGTKIIFVSSALWLYLFSSRMMAGSQWRHKRRNRNHKRVTTKGDSIQSNLCPASEWIEIFMMARHEIHVLSCALTIFHLRTILWCR